MSGNERFDSKIFNPKVFGQYIETIPNVKKTSLAKSKAIGTNMNVKQALATQTGCLYTTIPYYGRISGSTSQNNDGSTDISTSKLDTYSQGFITASRMDAWKERDFSSFITAGVPFMDAVAQQLADYKLEVRQDILLSMLKGVFNMNITGSDVSAVANAEFIENHTYDITDEDDGTVKSTTLNRAIQRASGDNKNAFKLVIMHSEIATNLENLKLLKYMTQTDGNGIERELGLATWNGRMVLIDDNMPTTDGNAVDDDSGIYYTTYVLGENAIIFDSLDAKKPYQMHEEPTKNGGEEILIVRDHYFCGVQGISFDKPISLTTSATNEHLADGENWNVINNGENAISHKAIPICRIISKG